MPVCAAQHFERTADLISTLQAHQHADTLVSDRGGQSVCPGDHLEVFRIESRQCMHEFGGREQALFPAALIIDADFVGGQRGENSTLCD